MSKTLWYTLHVTLPPIRPRVVSNTMVEIGAVVKDSGYHLWGLLKDTETTLPYAELRLYEHGLKARGLRGMLSTARRCALSIGTLCPSSLGRLVELVEAGRPPARGGSLPAYEDMRRLVAELARAGFTFAGFYNFRLQLDVVNDRRKGVVKREVMLGVPGRFTHQGPGYTIVLDGDLFGITFLPSLAYRFDFGPLLRRLGQAKERADGIIEEATAEKVDRLLYGWGYRPTAGQRSAGFNMFDVPRYDGDFQETLRRYTSLVRALKEVVEEVSSRIAGNAGAAGVTQA